MNFNTCLNRVAERFDPHSTLCTFIGVNNLVDSSSAWKNGEYQKSVAELIKAAVKWTAIGATVFGTKTLMHNLRPVHADILQAQANLELQEGGKASQTISVNTKQLLDHYAREKKFFKNWPEEGKTYINDCLESDSPVASASTEYFIQGAMGRKDSGFLRTAIKTCAKASVTTKSCEMVQEVASQSKNYLNQMVSACRKSDNAFCKSAAETKVNLAIKNNNWEEIVKTCVNLNASSESCTNGLKIVEEKINQPTKDAWMMAKKIDAACKNNPHLNVCQIAHKQIVTNTLKYGKWDEIMEVVNRKCSTSNKECIPFVEDVANSLIKELPFKRNPRSSYALLEEINSPYSHFGRTSNILLALSMVKNCVNNPSKITLDQARELLKPVEKYRDDLYSWGYWESELKEVLTTRIDGLKKKINALPAMPESPRTVPFTERPQPVAYKFHCDYMNPDEKLAIYILGRNNFLAIENVNRPHIRLKEDEVDWESCGL